MNINIYIYTVSPRQQIEPSSTKLSHYLSPMSVALGFAGRIRAVGAVGFPGFVVIQRRDG